MLQERDPLEPSFTYRVITTLLLFGLLLEWLLPWVGAGEWSSLLHPQALIWMTAIILAFGLFKPRIAYFILIGVVTGLGAMFLIYKGDEQSLYGWAIELGPLLAENVKDMLHYGIWSMNDEIRTILLFTGWLLLAPSLQSIVWYYQFSLSLSAVTLLYLITLHASLGIDIWQGMLRAIAEGLLLVAFTTLPKLQRRQLTTASWGKQVRYQYVSIFLLAVTIIAGGMAMSHNKEKRSEPVAWSSLFSPSFTEDLSVWAQQTSGLQLKNVTSSSYREGAVGMAGYGHDDSVLGQTLRTSDEVVFFGWSAQRSNWRAEIRSTYTGKGWSDQNGAVALHTIPEEAAAGAQLGSTSNRTRLQQSISYVEPQIGMPLMQSGTKGVVLELIASDPERNLSNYITETATGTLYSPIKDAPIKSYTVLTELPIVNVEELNDLEAPDKELAQRAWESDMLQAYLQLPEQLPERVIALAQEVSGGGLTSRYDQVMAIQQYLEENYTYSLKSSLPQEDEDFVDHFLFEQQKGYCVHFATAMVVMLRSQDIPARYVKGYQMGEAVGERTLDSGVVQTQYKVSAKDAHAWVEVYFPNVGWVAFDPTPGAEEDEAATAGIASQLGQLGDRIWTELYRIGSSITPMQWQLIGAAAAGLTLISLVIRLAWQPMRQQWLIRRYRRGYQLLGSYEQLLALPISYPSRNKKRLSMQQQARAELPKLQSRLQHTMELLITRQIRSLERGISDDLAHLTWRQRLESLYDSVDGEAQKQALKQLISQLERFYYSKQMTPPEPAELVHMFQGLSGKSGKGRKSSIRSKVDTDQVLPLGNEQYESDTAVAVR